MILNSTSSRRARRIVIPAPGLEYLAALSSRLNSTCSNRTASSSSMGRSSAKLQRDRVVASILAARCAASIRAGLACGIRHDRTGFELIMSSKFDKAIEPLGPSMMVERVGFLRVGRFPEVAQRAGGAEHPDSGVRRSCETR